MTTHTLPHTLMTVPHTRLTILIPGIVGLDGTVVGFITLNPRDGERRYKPTGGKPRRFGKDAWREYAAGCRDAGGNALDPSSVLDLLTAERSTRRALERAANMGETVAQAMHPYGDGYLPADTIRVHPDETRNHVISRADALAEPDGTWWRLYDTNGWVDLLTNEPAN